MAELEVKATEKHLRLSPRKVRLVIDLVRGKKVDEALGLLKMMSQGSGLGVSKAINAAASNAENNFGLNREDLYITTIFADKGPSRRWRKMGARSRVKPIERRSTHITVGVSEKESA